MIYEIAKILAAYFFLNEEKSKTWKRAFSSVTAIIPTYNESTEALRKTISSLTHQVNEIIVVDDGSKKPVKIEHLYGFNNTILVTLERNSGKKAAHAAATKRIDPSTDFVLVADSDTEFDPSFVSNALDHFDPYTAAVVGNIHIKDPKGMNRIIDCVYYNAFNMWRAALSFFGQVSVCSGAATIFRYTTFMATASEYAQRETNIGEDRFRTYLVLKENGKTKFSEDSHAYTIAPTGWKFIKQQLRWNKSFWLSVAYSWRLYLRPLMIPFTIDFLHNLLSRIGNIAVFFFIIAFALTGQWNIVGILLFAAVAFGAISGVYGAVRQRNISFIPLMALWSLASIFIIAPVNIAAIFTLAVKRWGTR